MGGGGFIQLVWNIVRKVDNTFNESRGFNSVRQAALLVMYCEKSAAPVLILS